MKHFPLILGALLISATLCAQEVFNPADAMAIGAGGTFGKAKIVPSMEKLAVAQFSVDYKQATTVAVTKREKKFGGFGKAYGKAATGSVTAYLETTDGELTAADFQEITDYGYSYLQKALKKAGYDTVAWSAVTATDFYKDGKEETADADEQEQSGGQWWTRSNAFHSNTLYAHKGTIFAFGKIRKASRFAEDLGAPVAFFNTTVDFADILVDVDVKTTGYRSTWTPSYNTIGQTTNMKSNTKVSAFMKTPANPGMTMFWDEKSHTEVLSVTQDIPAETNFSDGLSEDESRAEKRSKLFSVSFSKKLESAPVVIYTTKAKYKDAAKKALEKYADAFVAKAREMKKG